MASRLTTDLVVERLNAARLVQEKLLSDSATQATLLTVVEACCETLSSGGRILFCGNGGSAADAQHLAAELSGKFYLNRRPLDADALHVNSSYLTAVANDFSFDEVFSRQVEAKCRKGDVLVGISTSGRSKNVIKAIETARSMGVITVALTGHGGGVLSSLVDHHMSIDSTDTARIQEGHILIGHLLCEFIERQLFSAT